MIVDNGRYILRQRAGGVGIGRIGNDLYGRLLSVLPLLVKPGRKDHSHLDVAAPESSFQCLRRQRHLVHFEIPAGIQPSNQHRRGDIATVVDDHQPGVLYFIAQRKTKNQDLHDRHAKQDQQRAAVAQHVYKFFPNKKCQLLHDNR
jgi:hypothetical protein